MESDRNLTNPCVYYPHRDLLFSLFLVIFSFNLLHDKFSFLIGEFDVGCVGGFEALGERQFASGLGVSTSIWFLPLGHLGFSSEVFLFLFIYPLWMVVGCFHVHSAHVAFSILVSMMGTPLVLHSIFCFSFAVESEAPRIQGGSIAQRFPGIGPGLLARAVGPIVRARFPEPLCVEVSRHGNDFRVLLV